MDNLVKDLVYAARRLVASPLVSALAVLSLAVGIGANTTIFSLVNGILLRGLPVERPGELMAILGTDRTQGQQGRFMPVSYPNYLDYRDRSEVFSSMTEMFFTFASLVGGEGDPERVGVQMVGADYFATLGLRPHAGRFFLAEENAVPGRDAVAVLRHATWQRRFGADPGIIGRSVSLNGRPFTVIGVAPAGFSGTFLLGSPDLWVPSMMYEALYDEIRRDFVTERRALLSFAFGRLAPGVSREQAEASLQQIGRALEAEYPIENEGRNVELMPLSEASLPPQLRDNLLRAGGVLGAVVALVLLIACANVANLLLGRAMARRREIAVRLSLGSSRRRLIRQLLTESLLLAALGGAAGLLVAYWGRNLLWSLRPPFLAQAPLDLSLDGRVLAFTAAVTLATGLVFGLMPALAATRPQVVDALKQGGEAKGGGFALFSLRNLLVASQVALSLIALVGSALFLRSLQNAMEIDPGFAYEEMAMLTLDAGALGYRATEGEQFFDRVLERARSVPGVEAAALGNVVPLTFGGFSRTVIVDDRPPDDENNSQMTIIDPVGTDYFRTTGIPLVRGRAFSERDRADAPYVAIFSQAAAERFWPGEEAVGKRFRFFGEPWHLEVVGVAADSKHVALGEDPLPYIYLPARQHFNPQMALFLRAAGEPAAVLGQVRGEVQQLAPTLPLNDVQTLEDVMRQSLWAPRMGAGLLGILGGVALLLALGGIYGVMSYSVSQRRREIGIRMALGAENRSVVGLLARQGMGVVAIGLAVGSGLAWLLNRAAGSLLYGMEGTDLATLGVTLVVLGGVALVATLVPAGRASRIDPVVVLKGQR